MHLSEENQLDNRLRIAHKDMNNINLMDSDADDDEQDTTYDGDDADDTIMTEDNAACAAIQGTTMDHDVLFDEEYEIEEEEEEILEEEEEEIIEEEEEYEEEIDEEEEIDDDTNGNTHDYSRDNDDLDLSYREDTELTAATTNLLAEFEQNDEYNLDFDL